MIENTQDMRAYHFMKNIEVNVFNLQDVDIFAQK